ncbi:MAG: hypothetical protein NTZ74_01990 [Chloroflexi bacterium]|nr:hypothetical protein [Chloroflexota bacterium]
MKMFNPVMMMNDFPPREIRISEEGLQRVGLLFLGALAIFTILGVLVSPLDDQRKPILLLPEVRKMEAYRRSAREWIADLSTIDGEIDGVLAAQQQGDLFTRSAAAERTLQQALQLADQIEGTRVPPIGTGLQTQLVSTTMGYLEAARSALLWVSAPQSENLALALQNLEAARQERSALEQNQWLITP